MASNRRAKRFKKCVLGLGLGLVPRCFGIGPPYSLSRFLLSVFWVCLMVRSGEYNFRAISGVDPFPSLVALRRL